MDWDALLLLIIGAYLTARTGQLAYRLESLKHLCYTVSVLFFALGQGGIITETVLAGNEVAVDLSMYVELASYISISLLLCGLALLIRESKPVFAQFPLIYAGAPLLLIFSYWLVRNSFAIKEWLLSIYQGGAILVALLMFGSHVMRQRDDRYFTYMLGSSVLFLLTYTGYWFIPDISTNFAWIWQLLLGISLLAAAKAIHVGLNQRATSH